MLPYIAAYNFYTNYRNYLIAFDSSLLLPDLNLFTSLNINVRMSAATNFCTLLVKKLLAPALTHVTQNLTLDKPGMQYSSSQLTHQQYFILKSETDFNDKIALAVNLLNPKLERKFFYENYFSNAVDLVKNVFSNKTF